MAHLQLTVRNLHCYPCGLSFSNEDSFKNHHNSTHQNPSEAQSTLAVSPTRIKTENETNEEEKEADFNYDSSSQTTKKKRKRSMESYPTVKRNRSKISLNLIKSKSKPMEIPSDEINSENESITQYQNENTDNSTKNKNQFNPYESDSPSSSFPVLQTSNKINLTKYKDYIHCCKCFSTFYTLVDLIEHFDKCGVQPNKDDNFEDFKHDNSHNSPRDEDISVSPLTPENENDYGQEEEEMSQNNYNYSSASENSSDVENLHVNLNSTLNEDQDEDSDYEINSKSESESASESESEFEIEEVKKEKKKSIAKSQQQQQQRERNAQPNKRLDVPFKCPVESCSALSFPNQISFQQHKSQVHDINFKNPDYSVPTSCPTCKKTMSNQSELLEHFNYHTGYKPYKCNYEDCDKTFTLRKSYLQHLQSHSDNKKQFKCPEKAGCSESFTCKKELKAHIKSCHADTAHYICKTCGKGFLTDGARYNHQRRVHRELEFVCDFEGCRKACKSISDLKAHRVSHQDEKPFQCDFPGCQVRFKQKCTFLKHKRVIHQNQEECLCSECGKTFKGIPIYRRHLLVHTKEKSFICQYCGRAFAHHLSLKEHTLVHLGEKNRKCRFCDKTFIRWSAHKRHEQTHTKINPYKCAFCDSTFPDNRPLKKHVAVEHADQEFDLNNPSTYQGEKPSAIRNQVSETPENPEHPENPENPEES